MTFLHFAASAPFLLMGPGAAARILTMGMVCAVLIWFRHRTGA